MAVYNAKKTRDKALMEGGSVGVFGTVSSALVLWLLPDLDEEAQLAIIGTVTVALTGAFRGIRNWWKHR